MEAQAGTFGAIADILTLEGFKEGQITKKGLDWLRNELVRAKYADRVKLAGLREDRKAVIGGGLSVMIAVFDLLKIDHVWTDEERATTESVESASLQFWGIPPVTESVVFPPLPEKYHGVAILRRSD